jgi:hypothetical protein
MQWIERYTDLKIAEGVGFEPTDSLLSSAFKALALGRYANPPERDSPRTGALTQFWQSRHRAGAAVRSLRIGPRVASGKFNHANCQPAGVHLMA